MADDKKNTPTEKAAKKPLAAGKKLIARVALKGDFAAEDGLGVALQEIQAGQKFSTDDAKLQQQLIDQGYAKLAKDADKEEEEAPATSGSTPPKVESTDKK